MEHPSQPRSFRVEGHVMNSTLYFSKVGEFSYWGQSSFTCSFAIRLSIMGDVKLNVCLK